jgi:hypothetical protein
LLIVCEPQCVGISHEKVNSGFLSLLRVAYPDTPIRLYTDPSHRQALERVLAHDGIDPKIDYQELVVRDPLGVAGMLYFHRQFRRVLDDALAHGSREVMFLSTSAALLHLLKRLKAKPRYAHLRFVFVCHAELEDIANDSYRAVAVSDVREPTFFEKLRSVRPLELPGKARALVARQISARYAHAWKTRLRIREQLEWRASDDYAYIALAGHIPAAAARYVDTQRVPIRVVDMPYNFAPVQQPVQNAHLKLATFGFGDPAALRRIVDQLDAMQLTQPYEIRIIGMDNRGLENHPHVFCPRPGKQLTRAEMEQHAHDIDAFLILYGDHRYRLSCSGTIFETLSYVKPVLHIGNPCVVEFDRPERPIGYRAANLDELARLIAAMIQDYPRYREGFAERRRNILALREELSMQALAPKLQAVLRR